MIVFPKHEKHSMDNVSTMEDRNKPLVDHHHPVDNSILHKEVLQHPGHGECLQDHLGHQGR